MALRHSMALCLSVVSVVLLALFLALRCFSRHSQAYYTRPQCVRSAALVAKVYPLATVSGLLFTRAAWQYFSVWLAKRCRGALYAFAFPVPPFPLLLFLLSWSFLDFDGFFFITILAIIIWL